MFEPCVKWELLLFRPSEDFLSPSGEKKSSSGTKTSSHFTRGVEITISTFKPDREHSTEKKGQNELSGPKPAGLCVTCTNL